MDDDRVEKELIRLREDLREYHEDSRQKELDRRIENIQILIALAVVGASISIYSSQVINTPFWQRLLNSSYWKIVISAFVSANALFLILKLLTIPLQQISNSTSLSYVHDTVEPFLYFFAVAGALSAVIIGGTITIIQPNLDQVGQISFAIISLILPLISAVLYAQAYRLNISLERYQQMLLEIDRTFSLFVAMGAMTAEEQSKLIRQMAILLVPIPSLLSATYIRLIRRVAQRISLVSNRFADRFKNSNVLLRKLAQRTSSVSNRFADQFKDSNVLLTSYLDDILSGARYPRGVTSWLAIWYDLVDTQKQSKQISESHKRELMSEMAEIRNKATHGQLDNDDIDRIREILKQYDLELDSDDNSESEN